MPQRLPLDYRFITHLLEMFQNCQIMYMYMFLYLAELHVLYMYFTCPDSSIASLLFSKI